MIGAVELRAETQHFTSLASSSPPFSTLSLSPSSVTSSCLISSFRVLPLHTFDDTVIASNHVKHIMSATAPPPPYSAADMSDDSTFLFLAEMFPNLPLEVIERIMHTEPSRARSELMSSPLQTLIDRCLVEQSAIDAAATSAASSAASRSAPVSAYASAFPTVPAPPSTTPSAPLSDEQSAFEMTSLVPATSGLPEPSAPTRTTYTRYALMSAFAEIHGGILAVTAPYPSSLLTTSITAAASAAIPQLLRSLTALLHVITNVLQSPTVEKYRVLPLSNPAFQSKVLSLHGSKAALTALGFVEVEGSDVMVMSEERLDRQLLEEGQRHVEDEIAFVTALQPATPAVPASTKASSPYTRYDTVTENPLYKSKRDWKQDSDRPLHFPLTPTPRLSRDQLAALAEHRLRPKSTPAPTLQPSQGGEARQGRVMRLEAMRRRRAEVEAMRRDKRDQHWRTTAVGRKRTFTLDDIARMRKEELDSKARMLGGMSTDEQYVVIGKEAVRLTNEFRRREGLHTEVEWSDRDAEIGWKHSKAMGDGERPFGHDKFAEERASAMGYAASGENVFMCQGVAGVHVAAMAVEGWINSPGHRKNLLGERWTVCGIGVYRNEHGAWYLTQLFGSG